LVSIGVPVYNGERYLAQALESMRSQTYGNFEVIISDNGSTDRTQEICQKYVCLDSRFRYYRNQANIGVARNFNRVFELSSGEYFKWWAYDDLCAPTYLERCVSVLENEPSVMVCHTMTGIIDQNSKLIGYYDDLLHFRSTMPWWRFYNYLFRPAGLWNAIYGVIRSSEFGKTPLHGDYLGADQVLLGELVLRGEVHRIPENLFLRRGHPEQFWRGKASLSKMLSWFNPNKKKKIQFPVPLRLYLEYLRTVLRLKMKWYEQLLCSIFLLKWYLVHAVKPITFPYKKLILSIFRLPLKEKFDPWNLV